MHEFSTMQHIVDVILAEAQKHGAEKVTRVTLKIGELTFLGVEQLRFAFDILTKGTLLDHADLRIEKIMPEVKCTCGYQGATEYDERPEMHLMIPLLKCPVCGNTIEILKGRECIIHDIQMEVPG